MVIQLDASLEAAVNEEAKRKGLAPEALALTALRERFMPKMPPIVPQDEWERRLLAIGTDCGVSLPNSALSREEMYD